MASASEKKTTMLNFRDDKSVAVMKACMRRNGDAIYAGYKEYLEKNGAVDQKRPYVHTINLANKNKEERSALYRSRDPSVYDILQEQIGLWLHLTMQYSLKTTWSTTTNKWVYAFVIYGTWASDAEMEVAGANMMMKAASPTG